MKFIIIGQCYRMTPLCPVSDAMLRRRGRDRQIMPFTSFYTQQLSVRLTKLSPTVKLKETIVKEHAQHTIGVEFSSRTVKLEEKKIKLQVRFPRAIPSKLC